MEAMVPSMTWSIFRKESTRIPERTRGQLSLRRAPAPERENSEKSAGP